MPVELLTERIAIPDHVETAHTDGVVQEPYTASFHLQELSVHIRNRAPDDVLQAARDVRKARVQRLEVLGVLGDELATGLELALNAVQQCRGCIQRGRELERDAGGLAEGLFDEPLKGAKPAGFPAWVGAKGLRSARPGGVFFRCQGHPGRHRKEEGGGRVRSHLLRQPVADVLEDLGERSLRLRHVRFVHRDDKLLAPRALDVVQKYPFGFRKGTVVAGDEEDQVGAWDEIFRQDLVLPDDGVGPRRVHQREVLEERVGDMVLGDELAPAMDGLFLAIAKHGNLVGGRNRAFLHYPLAKQGIHQGRLSCVKFPCDNEKEQFVEPIGELGQAPPRVSWAPHVVQQIGDSVEKDALTVEQWGESLGG